MKVTNLSKLRRKKCFSLFYNFRDGYKAEELEK